MDIPKGFEVCFKCGEGANLIDDTASPPEKRVREFNGIKYIYKITLKCNNCGEVLHHYIPGIQNR